MATRAISCACVLESRGQFGRWDSLAMAMALSFIFSLLVPPAGAADILPILWDEGGLSAGADSAGQAARVTSDAAGNVAVVSGPSQGTGLAVTSYQATGTLRWKSAVTPSAGTFVGDWVAAAPNGDVVAVGRNVSASSGNPIGITLVRFGSEGTLQWRVDLAVTLPGVGRLLVDSGGNAYLAFNSIGDGQDIRLHKYDSSGDLLWSETLSTGLLANNVATSLALSEDETEVALTGDTIGGTEWITVLYDASTGLRRWLVTAAEGTANRDVVIDDSRVYVTGQGSVGNTGHLTVVAYDRSNGARLWRTDKKPTDAANAAGLRMALAPEGSLVVTGYASRGFLDWYTVALEKTGKVVWEAVRDGGLSTDEIPAGLLVRHDGITVVTGKGGPYLPSGFIPGVTVGYSPDGILSWEAFSPLVTVWGTALPNGDVCATGGYDAYVACFRPPFAGWVGTVADGAATSGPPLLVDKNPDGSLTFSWSGSCVATDTDYEIYEGSLGTFSSHAPVACSTGSLTGSTFTPSAGNTYYLVVARNDGFEGSYGYDSAGNPRPAGTVACLPMAAVLGCQ